MTKKTIKGRSKFGPPFIMVRHYVYDSAAYRSLTPADRSVYAVILRRYNGTNNGRIGMSVRVCAEEAGVNKDTVGACVQKLCDRGLIEIASESSLVTRMAREYRVTHERCDRTGALPSKAFLKWSPTLRVSAKPKPQPANDHASPQRKAA